MASVDEDGEADASRAAEVQQRIKRRADAAPGEEHVVDQDHGGAVDGDRDFAGANGRRGGAAGHVIPVEADIKRADGDGDAFEFTDGLGEPAGKGIAAREQADDDEAVRAVVCRRFSWPRRRRVRATSSGPR